MHDLVHLEPLTRGIPHTKRGHERCIAFLLSANELFLQYGYDAVSLDDIVNHAGGSKASLYKYFGNKDGLFTAICDYRSEQFFKDICPPFDFNQDNLRLYLIHTIINIQSHLAISENAAFLRLVMEQVQRNPQLALHIHKQGPKHIEAAIADILSQANQRGLIRCDHPAYSAQLFFGIVREFEWRVLMNLTVPEHQQENVQYVEYCVDRFLAGHQPL